VSDQIRDFVKKAVGEHKERFALNEAGDDFVPKENLALARMRADMQILIERAHAIGCRDVVVVSHARSPNHGQPYDGCHRKTRRPRRRFRSLSLRLRLTS
jgi:hypothetical protein